MEAETIACPHCGAPNSPKATWCTGCDQLLSAQPRPGSRTSTGASHASVGQVLAVVIIIAALLVAAYSIKILVDAGSANTLQVTQVYTESSFWLLLLVVFLLAGILWSVSARR